MKNPTSGDLSVMFNSIKAAQSPHDFLYNGYEVMTTGNPLAHAIMRGSVNKHGNNIQNYHYEDLMLANEMYKKAGYANPAIIVDANHSNSKKRHEEQPRIVKDVLHSRRYNPELKKLVKGVMIESYIEVEIRSVHQKLSMYMVSLLLTLVLALKIQRHYY